MERGGESLCHVLQIHLLVHPFMCLFMGLPHLSSGITPRNYTLHCLFVSSLIRKFNKINFPPFDLLPQSSWNAPAILVRMVVHVTIRGRDSIHVVVHKGTAGIAAKRVRK